MSRRKNAPYRDHIEPGGRALLYEGHDVPKTKSCPSPKTVDQPRINPGGSLTQNGLFEKAASNFKVHADNVELVAVYEKIHRGIWAFNGVFRLTDCTFETDRTRNVFQFRLELTDSVIGISEQLRTELSTTRIIPTTVKQEVWRRDKGRCVICGANDNLHFDHDVPYSKGGSSVTEKNIRLLCARHNLSKRDKIE
ncbi:MAG: HNH endonuclease [Acidobacteriota bacterium]|nr:HNH endonuclease [Acidobacteriota bacterium]